MIKQEKYQSGEGIGIAHGSAVPGERGTIYGRGNTLNITAVTGRD